MEVIITGSKREQITNFYRFCQILVDIGNKIARDYVKKIILDHGYKDIKQFFDVIKEVIINHPNLLGVNHLGGVIRVINKPEFNETLGMFDVGK